MQGVLLALMAFVLSGSPAPAAHARMARPSAMAGPRGAEHVGAVPGSLGLPACAIAPEKADGPHAPGADDLHDPPGGDGMAGGAEGDDTRLSSEPVAICWDSAGFRWERGPRLARHAADVATPAVIGCALVFGSHPAPARGAAESRPWSCEESGRHVYNTWYRVSRTPEIEPGHLQAEALENVQEAAESGGSTHWTSDAPRSTGTGPTLDHPLLASPAGADVRPHPHAVAFHEDDTRLASRTVSPPERPPRQRANRRA